MKQIVKLLRKTILFFIISCVFLQFLNLFFATVFEKRNYSSYFLSIIDKHINYNKNKKNKNLIIIGGSSNAFGINSYLIDSLTGLNTMNFGVHGDLGVEFMLSEGKFEADSNDIILANIEYELSNENVPYGGTELYQAIFESKGRILKYGKFQHVINTFFYGGLVLRNNILSYINAPKLHRHKVYFREAFDKRGDLQSQNTYNKNKFNVCHSSKNFQKSNFNPSKKYIKRLSFLENYCNKNNITLYISFPPIASSSYNFEKSELLFDMLCNENLNLINNPTDGVLCDTLFLGTNYHLTKFGRDIYSLSLANEINQALKKDCY